MPTEVRRAEVRQVEVRPAEVRPAEVRPVEVRPDEVRPAEDRPDEVRPAEVRYKFSTYATWWIRQAVGRSIADQARTIRIPVHMIEVVNQTDADRIEQALKDDGYNGKQSIGQKTTALIKAIGSKLGSSGLTISTRLLRHQL